MKIKDIVNKLEELAPPNYQESYDNSGVIVGNVSEKCTGALICLDSIEAVIDEAIHLNYNLVIAHHPIVFSGLKSITGKNYIEKTILKAIKNDITIYAIHTNLDSVMDGVNKKVADKLNIINTKILAPISNDILKLEVFVPSENVEEVKNAIFKAGGGELGNYDECSFQTHGKGNFKPLANSNPHIGKINVREHIEEVKIELILSKNKEKKVLAALFKTHPYEEVAYQIIPLKNKNQNIGAGMYGELEKPMKFYDFLSYVKKQMKSESIRYTNTFKSKQNSVVKTVAFCGGSGSFLLKNAKKIKADVFITGDFKYHQFFDAENDINILDIGHFESEQFTIELIYEYLTKIFPNFAFGLTKVNTNPINYF